MKARAVTTAGGIELRAPGVGLWREQPARGTVLRPGMVIGRLEVLGAMAEIVAPSGAKGVVVAGGDGRARQPVGYDDVLLLLDPSALGAVSEDTKAPVEAPAAGLTFRSPSSGRFYARPAPDRDPFVKPGDIVKRGAAVAMLEVMKTFNRIQLAGDDLPDALRVVRVLPADGDDVEAGDVLLELELP